MESIRRPAARVGLLRVVLLAVALAAAISNSSKRFKLRSAKRNRHWP
jgi:hypothetical protein